jgi:hypothetical protein
MPTECREHLALILVGDAARCEQDRLSLAADLRGRLEEKRVFGSAVQELHGPKSVIDEDPEAPQSAIAAEGAGMTAYRGSAPTCPAQLPTWIIRAPTAVT